MSFPTLGKNPSNPWKIQRRFFQTLENSRAPPALRSLRLCVESPSLN